MMEPRYWFTAREYGWSAGGPAEWRRSAGL